MKINQLQGGYRFDVADINFSPDTINKAHALAPIGTEKYDFSRSSIKRDLAQALNILQNETSLIGVRIQNNLNDPQRMISMPELIAGVKAQNKHITDEYIINQLHNERLFVGIQNHLDRISDKSMHAKLIQDIAPRVLNDISLQSNDFPGTYLDNLMMLKEYIDVETIANGIAGVVSDTQLKIMSTASQGNLYKFEIPRLHRNAPFFTDPTPNPVYDFAAKDIITSYNIYSEFFEHRDAFNPFVLLQSFYGWQSSMKDNMTMYGTQVAPTFLAYLLKNKMNIGRDELEGNIWLGRRAYNPLLVTYDNPGLAPLDPTTLNRPATDAKYSRMNGIVSLLDYGAASQSDPFFNPIKIATQGPITTTNIQSILDAIIIQFATDTYPNLLALYDMRENGQGRITGTNTPKVLKFLINAQLHETLRNWYNSATFKGQDWFLDTVLYYKGYEFIPMKKMPNDFIMMGQFSKDVNKSEIIVTFNTFDPANPFAAPYRLEPFANGQDGVWELFRMLFGVGLPKGQIVYYSTTNWNQAYPLRPMIQTPQNVSAQLPIYN